VLRPRTKIVIEASPSTEYSSTSTTVGGISIEGGALVKLSQNALFTHFPVALVQRYKLAVAILRVSISSIYELAVAVLRTFINFYAFSLILRIFLDPAHSAYLTVSILFNKSTNFALIL
jgi:hypothetical protein